MGGLFDPILFLDFLHFLENYSSKSEILGSTDKTGCGKLSCISGYAQIVLNNLLWRSEKKSFRFFHHFLKLLDFSRKLDSQI